MLGMILGKKQVSYSDVDMDLSFLCKYNNSSQVLKILTKNILFLFGTEILTLTLAVKK